MPADKSNKIFHWKGKRVTEKVYRQRLRQTEHGKSNRIPTSVDASVTNVESLHPSDSQQCPSSSSVSVLDEDFLSNSSEAPKTAVNIGEEQVETNAADGKRIVNLQYLGEQLWCVSCKECLSLSNIENEFRKGLGSILTVRCHKCLLLNEIKTGKQHSVKGLAQRTSKFDVNSKFALGLMHAGIGFLNWNKLASCLNIPTMCFKTYKRYESEVGNEVENTARESCERAASLERELTIKQASDIQENLPENMKSCFYNADSTEQQDVTTFNDVVNIMASYDRDYDSLSGFASLVGALSGKIRSYGTCNRECAKCDLGQSPFDHNCRLNFRGSAKAMEAHVANKLVNESDILKSKNIQVGILVGDDDSSAIAACRANSSHPIGKLSDVNHTSKTVKKQIFDIAKKHREVIKDAVLYLHRCFTYCMAQNRGDSRAMAEGIRCIPHHAFNNHTHCGQWCGYIRNKENYDHKIISGGFQDKNLYTDLVKIFDKLACNAEKFSVGVSSNVNESINSSMASKSQKAKCLSKTASSDYRYAAVVAQKNNGEKYTKDIINSYKK